MSHRAHWTCESALTVLREAAQERGGPWTKAAWSKAHKRPSTATLEQIYGSWSRAWDMAGYPIHYRWTPSGCLNALREAGSKQGHWLTMAQWNYGGYAPSVHVILRHFGHWRVAWQAAGFETPLDSRHVLSGRTWTKTEIIKALRQHARPDDTLVGMVEWRRRRYQPSITTIRKHWGSYARAAQAAGLRVQTDRHREVIRQREAWQKAWVTLSQELGHPPSREEWEDWPQHPVTAKQAWPVLDGCRAQTPLRREASRVDVDFVSKPYASWILAYGNGVSLKEIAQSAGVTRDSVRQGLIRGMQQARVVAAAYEAAQALDPAGVLDGDTRALVIAMRARLPLCTVMEQSGLTVRQIIVRIKQTSGPTVVSSAVIRRLAKDVAQQPVLWSEADYVWVQDVLDAGSAQVYSDLHQVPLPTVIDKAYALHAAARRKPVWVQWARQVLEHSGTLLPIALRQVLEGLAIGESLRQVTERLGQDYARTNQKLYRLRQSDWAYDRHAAQR